MKRILATLVLLVAAVAVADTPVSTTTCSQTEPSATSCTVTVNVTCTCAAVPAPSPTPTPGPLNGFFTSFWKLADLTDAIGSNTLTNSATPVTFSAGKIGDAGNFDATNLTSLSVADTASLRSASQFTIVLWWNGSLSGKVLLGKDSNADREFSIDGSGAVVRFYINGGGGGQIVSISHGDGYHMVVAWYDGSVVGHHTLNIVYDNGTTTTTDVGAATPAVGAASFRIGARDFVGAEGYFTGQIDAVGWAQGKVPTSEQLTALWNGGAGVEPPF